MITNIILAALCTVIAAAFYAVALRCDFCWRSDDDTVGEVCGRFGALGFVTFAIILLADVVFR